MSNNIPDFNQSKLKIAFIKADISDVQNELVNWQTPLVKKHNNSLSLERINGNFNSAYEKLFPLTTVEIRRYIILPTMSQWVGIMDNSSIGTDRTCPFVLAERLKTEHIFMFYNKISEECLIDYFDFIENELTLIRTVGVTKENGWKFHQYGKPLGFEQTENYSNKVVKSRFKFNQLDLFLQYFGINAFKENYYMPENSAVLIKKAGPLFPATREIAFEEFKLKNL